MTAFTDLLDAALDTASSLEEAVNTALAAADPADVYAYVLPYLVEKARQAERARCCNGPARSLSRRRPRARTAFRLSPASSSRCPGRSWTTAYARRCATARESGPAAGAAAASRAS